jgi:hypothetical protein
MDYEEFEDNKEYPYKQKPKRKIGNVLFWLIIVVLLLYLLLRTEVNSEQRVCSTCKEPEDCENTCVKFCLSHITDIITTSGFRNESTVYCQCNCKSNLHVIVDRFL